MTDTAPNFDWIPIYKEIADNLIQFKDNRQPLIKMLDEIFVDSVKLPNPFKDNHDGIVHDVCPFTVFASFNRNIKYENRIKIVAEFKKRLNLKSSIPTSFDAVPLMSNQSMWFYKSFGDRGESDIPNLWEFFETAIKYADNPTQESRNKFVKSYETVIKQGYVKWNITMGLFWIRPEQYINLDSMNRQLINTQQIISKSVKSLPNGETYLSIIDEFKQYMKNPEVSYHNFSEMSHYAFSQAYIINDKPESERGDIDLCWYVGAQPSETDKTDEFLRNGVWKNGEDKLQSDLIKTINEGDKIAIKATYTQKNNLPFDVNGKTVSVMSIKAIGTVTKNYNDGINLDVSWKKLGKPKIWYFYTLRRTVGKVESKSNWMSKALLDFTFKDTPQDYNKFLKEDYWSEKYVNEPTVEYSNKINYWWLNANPKNFSFSELEIGEEEPWTRYNENGRARNIPANFKNAKQGDTVICYESTPTKQILAIAEISKIDDKNIWVRKTENLSNPIPYSVIKETPELQKMEYLTNQRGSLFKLSDDEYGVIMDIIRDENPREITKEETEKYTESDFLSDVFISKEKYQAVKNLLLRKQNIILSGPPGVGKTFSAKRLAYSIIGYKDKKFIRTIQFHQNYSYEDFIQGFRPTDEGFKLINGPFYDFCKKAESDPENKYFFIIDEINRGNLSKIFGELLMLIESDKREVEKIKLLYSETLFSVPNNIYIIGMMNTSDRSLAMIDYALRRRFSFIELEPAFDSEGFEKQRQKINNPKYDELINAVKFVNSEILKDSSLGDGCLIGHSYLCPKCEVTNEWIESVIEYELIPLIREYWFDNKTDFDVCSKKLRSVLSDK